ncbi:MAG: D-Ala-D-Ala carboxypeptidase family metallohydrolase [Cyanobacteria bacterium P01_F01_bin.150]
MSQVIEALQDTWLKKDFQHNADQLDVNQKIKVLKGKCYPVTTYDEKVPETDRGGHFEVTLAYEAGTWYIFAEHWLLPWQRLTVAASTVIPEWNEVNWHDYSAPVSKYFNVGEVTNMSKERIPTDTNIKKNIIKVARCMDEIREWWGGPLAVNSWYRPPHVNARIGSRAPNHPGGYAVDFRPLSGGTIWELQKRFKSEWYDTGRWNGGFGLGAQKGFIHIDLRHRRIWDY